MNQQLDPSFSVYAPEHTVIMYSLLPPFGSRYKLQLLHLCKLTSE